VFLCLLVCLCVFVSRKIPCNLMQGPEVTLQIVQRHVGNFCKFLAKLPAFNRRGRVKCLLVFWHVFKTFQNVPENVRIF